MSGRDVAAALQAAIQPVPEVLPLVLGLLAGLALFLFGLDLMTTALKAVAGDRLRTLLGRLTANRFLGVATGAFVTAVIQSSSVTTVLVVSFISSGLMSLSQSVGVILGANIGTTVTAQIIAFKVTKLAFAMIALGFALAFLSRRERLRHHGNGIFALGLVFLGMTLMGESMAPLRDHPGFAEWLVHFENPALGIAVAALFTALVQSSSATTGVVIAMASQGLITLPAGIALLLGANVGTCVTALLASIGRPREALRAALVHVLFNVLGVLLWFGFVDELARAVAWLSPKATDLRGLARLAAETPRQLANAHTLFNVANTAVFLPFSSLLAALVERLVPDRPLVEEDRIRARYLDEALLPTPSLALQQARRETVRLLEYVERMLDAALPAVLHGDREALEAVAEMDEAVDALYDHIISYLGRISQSACSQQETRELVQLMGVVNAIESMGDVVESDLVARGRERVAAGLRVSPATAKVLEEFHGVVAGAVHELHTALDQRDAEAARRVTELKPTVQGLAERAALHGAQRLTAPEARRLPTYAVEVHMIEDLRRIFYFAKRIARGVLTDGDGSPAEGPPAMLRAWKTSGS